MAQQFEINGRTYTYRVSTSWKGSTISVKRDDGAKGTFNGWARDLRDAIPTMTFFLPKKVDAMPRGECQLCCHEQAIKSNGRMHRHGYRRPGWGFIVGGCPGQHRLPFPQTDALEEVVPQVVKHIEYVERMSTEASEVEVIVKTETKYVGRTPQRTKQVIKASNAEEYDAALTQVDFSYRSWNPRTYDEAVEKVRRGFAGEAVRARSELKWIEERIEKGRAIRAAK